MTFSRRQFFCQTSAALIGARAHAAEDGFRELFDGRTLDGWKAIPRLNIPKGEKWDALSAAELQPALVAAMSQTPEGKRQVEHVGRWQVVDGAIVGGQEPAGSGLGGYLMTEATFSDFELEVDARPDWPVDTGIMFRAHEMGTAGFQCLIDHRPEGAIGGIFGNGIGSFHAATFGVGGDEQPGFKVGNFHGLPREEGFIAAKPQFGASFDAFQKAWRVMTGTVFAFAVSARCRSSPPGSTTPGSSNSTRGLSTRPATMRRCCAAALAAPVTSALKFIPTARWVATVGPRVPSVVGKISASKCYEAARKCLLALVLAAATSVHAGERAVNFAAEVRPILSQHCFKCHGPDKQKGGLRLDTEDGARKPSDSVNAAIVPGKPDASELLLRVITSDEDERMPPEGKRLTTAQIDTLRRWISAGGKYEAHWAFQKIVRPELPLTSAALPPDANAIDAFVRHELEETGGTPAPEADRLTLIRRVSLDLVGLPPTPDEADAFAADPSADAYEQLVDRLLASPRYGERWASPWLDLARYGESAGGQHDIEMPLWPYRDWVIQAFNADMPFDEFTRLQIAGISWETMARRVDWTKPTDPKKADADMVAFLHLIADKWYRIHREVILENDANHLLLGDKNMFNMRYEWVLTALKNHVDVVAIQTYGFWADDVKMIDEIYAATGKPIFNGDGCYSFAAPQQKEWGVKGWRTGAKSIEEVAKFYRETLEGMMATPYIIGWHHCGYLQQWDAAERGDSPMNENGFLDPFETKIETWTDVIEVINDKAASLHDAAEKR